MSTLTTVFRTRSEIEANIVQALLASHGVQSVRTAGAPPGMFAFTVSTLGETRLSVRDEEANTFDTVLTLDVARDDAPEELDRKKVKPPASPKKAGHGPLSDHQLSQVMVAYRLDELLPPNKGVIGRDPRFGSLGDIYTEQLAVEYIRLVSGRARDYWGA